MAPRRKPPGSSRTKALEKVRVEMGYDGMEIFDRLLGRDLPIEIVMMDYDLSYIDADVTMEYLRELGFADFDVERRVWVSLI